jgi:hypothetical protein
VDHDDKTSEHLETPAERRVTHSLMAGDICLCDYLTDCLCQPQFMNYYLMILNFSSSVVGR